MNNLFDGEDNTKENQNSENQNLDNNTNNKGNENKKEEQLEYNNHNTTEVSFEQRNDFNEAYVSNYTKIEEILFLNSPHKQNLEKEHQKGLNNFLEPGK